MAARKSGIDLYRAAAAAEKDKPASTPDRPPGGFLKVTDEKESEGSGGSKAARLMLLLGTDEAAKVMATLSPGEAENVARQIAATRRVDTVEARALLEELGQRVGNGDVRRARGGIEAARAILESAFGPDKADRILSRAVPEAVLKPFAFLDDLTFPQLANLLRRENPVTLALVMSCIDPRHASRLLESLPDSERAEVVLRMARNARVSNDVLATVETALQEKLRLIGRDDSQEMDGRSALADILRYMDLADERRLLDELETADPHLAGEVKQKLYTMDTVLHLRKRDLQTILLQMNEKDIALLLKGQPPEIRDYILSGLSSRRRLLVADEGDLMGPVPRSEADAAVRGFLERLESGEREGTYIIVREESDLV